MNTILLVLCNALSCFIISTILFQFMNGKYKKSSRNRYVYIVIETTTVIFTFCINMLNHSILNLVVWGVLTGIIVYVLYYEDIDKPLRRIIECEALVFCMSVCESLGVILLQCILQAADIKNVNETMLYCLEVTFSKVILIFLYYTFINRFVKKSDVPYSKTRYIMYGIILLYSLINMSVIVENFKNGEENYLCAVNMGCIVLADLYLLYFVKMADEKNYYEKQLIALEQQAKVQYEYYLTQAKKYDQTIQILHDVNKHIKAIEGLYGAEQEKTAGEYATKIRELLKPLIPVQYTENPILNILLTDKESVMREKGISVTIKIDNVNLNFIEPIDITTIFGNLLDNAIEATEKLKGEKYICIKIGSYHKMIVVSIENNCNEVKWRNGFPVSNKGKNGGGRQVHQQPRGHRPPGRIRSPQQHRRQARRGAQAGVHRSPDHGSEQRGVLLLRHQLGHRRQHRGRRHRRRGQPERGSRFPELQRSQQDGIPARRREHRGHPERRHHRGQHELQHPVHPQRGQGQQ